MASIGDTSGLVELSRRRTEKYQVKRENSDGFLMKLPISLHEAYKLHLSKPDHPGVKLFGSSIQAQRSCHEAIIFLYGVSGAGKSSTINHLFANNELLPTSGKDSCTDNVTEWVSNLTSKHWEVSNLELGFIDVPGWGDTKGRDATNFALIEHFLSIHPILGSKIRKFYPNIVLLVFNSTDNRMVGNESNAQKMLQGLAKLDIVDRKHPNVVIVLTHVCHYPHSEFVEKLEELSKIYRTLSRSNLGVDPPVVWLENNYLGYELTTRGDWTLLHDGTAQPLNLYEAMKYLMKDSNDELGKEAIRLYFDDRTKYPPIERLTVNSQKINSECRHQLEEQWLELFSRKNLKYKLSELNMLLLDYVASHEEMGLNKSDIEGLLLALTYSDSFPDVNSIRGQTLLHVQEKLMPFPLNVKEKQLLINALELVVSNNPECLDTIGKGYNIIKEQICSSSPFEMSESKYLDVFLNCFISKSRIIFPCNTQRLSFGGLGNKMLSIQHKKERLLSSSFGTGTHETQEVKSLKDNECKTNETERIMFRMENGSFMASLNFQHVRLSKEFVSEINSLPEMSLDQNRKTKKEYNIFFDTFGHFVILKANVGGIIEGKVKVKSKQVEYISKFYSLILTYIELIKEGNNWKEYRNEFLEDEQSILEILDSAPLEWLAGDQAYSSESLEKVTKSSFEKWQDSLKSFSIPYNYSFALLPIYLLAQRVNSEKANQIKIAFQSLVIETNAQLYNDEDDTQLEHLGSEFDISESNQSPPKSPSKAISRHRTSLRTVHKSKASFEFSKFLFSSSYQTNRNIITENDKTNIENLQPTCFPAESYVISKNGTFIKMKDLEIGDHIVSLDMRTHRPVYSKVYMWGHLDPDLTATFIEIHYDGGVLRLTEDHLLLSGHDMSFTTAARVRRGDVVYGVKMTDTQSLRGIEVKSVNRVKLTGVYAPFTHNSLIVVDGLVCSAFAVPDLSITKFDQFEKMSRICMSPKRLLDSMGISRIHKNPLNDSTKIDWYAEMLLRLYSFLLFSKLF